MADTDFSQFNPSAVNAENDAAYQGDSTRSGGIAFDQVMSSLLGNKILYQASTMNRALALMMVDKGFSPKDGTSPYTADTSSNAAVTALKTVLDNILTTTDRPAPLRDTTVHNHTGDTTLDTVVSLGPTVSLASPQMVRITSFFNIAVQGAGNLNLEILLNSIFIISYSLTAVAEYVVEMMVNLTNNTVTTKLTKAVGSFSGTSDVQINNTSVGLGIPLTFVIKAQNANNSDSQFFNWTLLEIL